METIFVSYHFDDDGRKLAEHTKELLRRHNIHHSTGEPLASTPLSESRKENQFVSIKDTAQPIDAAYSIANTVLEGISED